MVLLFISAVGARAQVSKTTGAIEGTVTDSGGIAVAGAEVQLANSETGQSRQARTDNSGRFLISGVAAATYELSVAASGFATYRNKAVEVGIGSVTEVNIRLLPATVEQQVTVSGEAPPIDVAQTTVATTVGPERIEESPVVTRSYLNFVLLAPSLTQSNQERAASSGGAVKDSGFSFAGLRARSNSLYIDGVENNDEFDGSVRTELSPETIHEFQVVNNGISAESGGGAGGSINVVTKSGANIHHGDAFLFVQNGVLNAREPLTNETSKPDLDRERVGAALGGAIVRDRTFYYLAGEQERSKGEDASLISPAVATTINGMLNAEAFPGLRTREVNAGNFRVERAETEASARLDHQLSAKHTLLAKYAFTNNREVGDAFNVGGFTDPSARGRSFTRDEGFTAGLSSVLSSSAVNDAGVQISRRNQVLRTADQSGPGVFIPGAIEFGTPYSGNSSRTEDHYEFLNTTSIARGRHLLKFGADVDRIHESAGVADAFAGYYIFPTLASFMAGNPDEYVQSWGSATTRFGATKFAGFVQEHWALSRQVTVDAGVRYEFEQLPSKVRQDTNNFAPRLGIAYSPSGNWVVRAGFGVFYDRYVLAAVNRALEWDGANAFQQVVYGTRAAQVWQSATGGKSVSPIAGVAPSIYTAAPDMATPYSQIVSAGVQRLVTNNLTVSATYLFTHGVKLSRTVNINLLPPLTLTSGNAPGFSIAVPQQIGRAVFGPGRMNPAFDNIWQWQNEANSNYHGVTFAVNRRLANEVEFSGSYTFSKALDDASDFNEQPQNPYALRAERSVSANDQRHRFVFSGTFDLPFGDEEDLGAADGWLAKVFGNIEAAPIVMIGSGRPVNALVGFDANRNGALPLSSRPLDYARNSLRTRTQAEVDLRLLKYFKIGEHGKLDFVAEAFNLLNHTNVLAVNPYFGGSAAAGSGFGQPIRAGMARQLQFSIDFEF